MSQLSERQKLVLKIYIRLLFYVKKKFHDSKFKITEYVSDLESTSDNFYGYLQKLKFLIEYNRSRNRENIDGNRAIDETTVDAISKLIYINDITDDEEY
jgi:hypothetical protein